MRNRQCIKKYAESKGLTFVTGATFVQHYVSSDRSYFFYDSGKWEDRTSSGINKEGKWQCDGSDNYFIWHGNKKYVSRDNKWYPMNTIFNCVKEDLESRGMNFEFTANQLKLPFKSGNHFTFYEDGKWEAFEKAKNKNHKGTWQCDGEDAYQIFTEFEDYSSKTNQWK
jgi:hypothetical protein